MSLAAEKLAQKQLDVLKGSLPYAEPLEEVSEEIKKVLEKKREYGK